MGHTLSIPRTMSQYSPSAKRGRVIGWHYDYHVRVGSISAHSLSPVIDLEIQLGHPFCLRAIGGYNVPTSLEVGDVAKLNDCLLRFTNDNENFLQSQPIGISTNLGDWPTGGADALYEPVHQQVVFAPNSILQLQVTNNGSATLNDVHIIFRGTKLFYEDQLYCPTYPGRYTSLPYQYPVQFPFDPLGLGTITIPALGTLRDVPLQAFGADFVIRGGTFHPISGVTGNGNVEFRLRDQENRPYANDFIHSRWLFSDSQAQRPGIWYPEIYLPKDRILLMDVRQNENSQAVVQACFEGARVFAK
jgi:hypothetical protein